MKCVNCGKDFEKGKFCRYCGHKLEQEIVNSDVGKRTKIRYNGLIERLKSKEYLIVIGIILFALVIRMIYFNMNTAIWWDEGEYLSMAKVFSGQVHSQWWEIRPVIMSLIWAGMYKIGIGSEVMFRFTELLFSIAGIVLLYYLAKDMFNMKVAIISSLLLSVFWLDIFYSSRLLMDVPSATMATLLAFLFWHGYVKGKRYCLWLLGPAMGLGIMLRFTVGIMAIVILMYLLITERFRFLKNKDLWICAVTVFLVLSPYLMWSYVSYGNPLHPLIGSQGVISEQSPGYEKGLMGYLAWFPPHYLHWVILVLLIVGFYYFIDFFLGLDMLFSQKNKKLNKYLFLFLWIILTLCYFSFMVGHDEDRYLLPLFPAIFMIASLGAFLVYTKISKFSRIIAVLVLVILLGAGAYQQLTYGNLIIMGKASSFSHVKETALWIKDHSSEDDYIVTGYQPIVSYYSSRSSFMFPKSEGEFNNWPNKDKLKYFVLFAEDYDKDKWEFQYPVNNNLTVAKAFYSESSQPMVVIYNMG